ncbi:MAG: sigma-54 dependent transcriptional regulator [Pseudomonadota bacterium]
MVHVLLVDDEADFSEGLAEILRIKGHTVVTADSVGASRQILARSDGVFDLVLIDLMLPDGNGLELLSELSQEPGQQLVIMTGHHSIKRSIRHLHGPSVKYLIKPIDPQELDQLLGELRSERSNTVDRPHRHLDRFVGNSDAMLRLYEQIRQVAPTDSAVLISGESGTGKELVAEAIHRESRVGGPFVPINCGALTNELLASELFGHEAGSFTGARKKHLGVFERADQGTLFLDEVTEMPIEQQPHLLRAIESKQITRVGGEGLIDVAPRIVAACNRELGQALDSGLLREDLYFRLSVFPIEVPPLRQRVGDVERLARDFLAALNMSNNTERRLSSEGIERLSRWSWPGNVRELKHAVHRAYISTSGDDAELSFPERFDSPLVRQDRSIEPGRTVRDVEKELILTTLEHFDGSRKQAAEMLGISVKTLYNRLVEYGEA